MNDNPKRRSKNGRRQPTVIQEAWERMNADLDRILPRKLRQGREKKKIVLWLLVAELVGVVALGTVLFNWLRG